MSKSHLFLKNEFGISRIFNRTRGRDDNEETLEDGKNYSHQRESFHRCRIEFDQALENVTILFSALTRMFPKPTFAP